MLSLQNYLDFNLKYFPFTSARFEESAISFRGNLKKNQQLIYSCFLQLSTNFHMLSDEYNDVSWSAGFMGEKKSHAYANTCRWPRHIRAYFYTCVRACGSKTTHACTCELTIERTRFSVSHRRLFPHVVLRHGSLVCSPPRLTLPRLNPYHRPFRTLLASPSFLPLVIPFRPLRTSNRCAIMVRHVRHYGTFRVGFATGNYLEKLWSLYR